MTEETRHYVGEIYSNFDQAKSADFEEIDKKLKDNSNNYVCYHTWNFCALISYKDNKYFSEVKQRKVLVSTIINEDFGELLKQVNEKYGNR